MALKQSTYCSIHSKTNAERNAEYDRTRRDKKAKIFYNSNEWKIARITALTRDNGIEIYLYVTDGIIVPATMVHHIVELKENYNMRCKINNLISVSEATHEGVIKQAYKEIATKHEMQRVLRDCISKYKKSIKNI